MTLTPKERQHLKALAHKLKPVVMVGNNGITDAVSKEIDRTLNDHELIKIRVQTQDRDLRKQLFTQIQETAGAELIQTIGSIGIFYRLRKK